VASRGERDWGEQSSTPHKGHICKSPKTAEKILEVWRVTSPTILEFQPEFVTSGFQKPDLTYILSNLLTNFILLNLVYVIWNSCAMPFGWCIIKLELIKFARLLL